MNRLAFFFFIAIIIFNSCRQAAPPERLIQLKGVAFGTNYAVSYYTNEHVSFDEQIDSLLNDFKQSVSYYEENSLISNINRNETNEMDNYFSTILKESLKIYEKTDSAFDVTVAPLVNAWGFGFTQKKDMSPQKIDSILQFIGLDMVNIKDNRVIKKNVRIQFDFNGIAKGYGSDLIANFLQSKGITSYMVNIGGDLIVGDAKPDGSPWMIALERPAKSHDDPQQYDHIAKIKNRAVATSGNYRRYHEKDGKRYSHTINPKTGYPVQNNLLSVTVFADDCMTADGYATAFMVMGKEKSQEFVEKRDGLDAYFIFSKNTEKFGEYATKGFDIIEKQ